MKFGTRVLNTKIWNGIQIIRLEFKNIQCVETSIWTVEKNAIMCKTHNISAERLYTKLYKKNYRCETYILFM